MFRFLFFLFVYSISIRLSHAQSVTINDIGMRAFYSQFYPNCISGAQLDTTCSEIVNEGRLEILYQPGISIIQTLEGLEYFDNADTISLLNFPSFIVLPPLRPTV